jgi:hypothetical protein
MGWTLPCLRKILERIEEKIRNCLKQEAPDRKKKVGVKAPDRDDTVSFFKPRPAPRTLWKRGGDRNYLYALKTRVPCSPVYHPDNAEFLRLNYEGLSKLISGICRARHMTDVETEDIRGEFFRRYLQNGKYDPSRGDLRLYIMIMLSCIFMREYTRKLQESAVVVHDDGADAAVPPDCMSVELDVYRQALERLCRAGLDRKVLKTFRMKADGMQNREIAGKLGVSEVAVGQYVSAYQRVFKDLTDGKSLDAGVYSPWRLKNALYGG